MKRKHASGMQIPLGPAWTRLNSMANIRQVIYARRAGTLFHYNFLKGLGSLHFNSQETVFSRTKVSVLFFHNIVFISQLTKNANQKTFQNESEV